MTVVSAFLVSGNPLPLLKEDNPPWKTIAEAARSAGRALAESKPDVLLIYSTQWFAVLDQLWQTREHSTGVYVDQNWYEYGDLQMDLRTDVELAKACVETANQRSYPSKAVDYEDFPIDTGTIVANAFLNPGAKLPAVVAANNLYHDFDTTVALGKLAAEQAAQHGRRAAVIAVGGLSANYFDHDIDITQDRIVNSDDDLANRALLAAMEKGGADRLRNQIATFNASSKGDMGLKHLGWLLGGVGDFSSATVHGYGATYGSAAAVVQFHVQ